MAYKRPHLKGAIGQGPLLWAIWKRGLGGKEVGERRGRGVKKKKGKKEESLEQAPE